VFSLGDVEGLLFRPRPRFGEVGFLEVRKRSKLSERTMGLGLEGRLPERMRRRILSSMIWPALGAAVTTVPEEAVGGGVGLQVRNRGWMWSSLDGDRGEVGRENVGWGRGLGGELSGGLCWKNGPSRAFAGEGERLPGMGSRMGTFIVEGEEWRTVSRMWGPTPDVSQESNASSWETRLDDGLSEEEFLEWRGKECWRPTSLVLDSEGRRTVDREER